MKTPIIYSFKRCPYAMRARMAIKLANITCEIREVDLKNKPTCMLQLSPKATVPVLLIGDMVIDESLEIIDWVLSKKNIFKNNLTHEQEILTTDIIKLFDIEFKHSLDRYKYNSRYSNTNRDFHKEKCIGILKHVEASMNESRTWFFSNNINKLDISVLPFIRQFRLADEIWFDNTNQFLKIKKWLYSFLNSELLKSIMIKKDFWVDGDRSIYFPYEE